MVQNRHYAMGRADILAALTAYIGITTHDGALGGSTLTDVNLRFMNDFISSKTILIGSGNAIFETSSAKSFNSASGVITVDPPFSAQILRGTLFRVLNFPAGAAVTTIISIINGLIAATLVTTETGGVVTTNGAEQDVYINNAPLGVYEPRVVKIDFTNQTAAETVVVRVYYRLRAGGNLILQDQAMFAGVQAIPLKNIELEPNRFGIRISMQRTAGGAQNYDWEVIYRV